MRRARIKAEGAGYYHCMSRVIERRHIFSTTEKERFRTLMRNLAGFGGLDPITKPRPGGDCGLTIAAKPE